MKTKKTLVVLLLVCGLLAGGALQAAAAWYTCTVNQAGPFGVAESSSVRIFLTDDGAAWEGSKEFKVNVSRANSFLAVALTAMANGKKVRVSCANIAASPAAITAIYLQE